ncbi:MAG: hypothetical protein AB1730_15215 [Myxococcota bacterium]
MRRAWLLPLAAACWSACATTPRGPGAPDVEVTRFEVRLDAPDDGAVGVTLALPPPREPFREVEWELYLGGLRVAVGLERVQRATPLPDGRVAFAFDSPLIFKGVPWRAGSAFVQARLLGVVRFELPATEALEFSTAREALVRGVPELQRSRD